MPFDGTELSPLTKHLMAAKAYIIEHGWCQKVASNLKGNVCIIGAIQQASPDRFSHGYSASAIELLNLVVHSIQSRNPTSLAYWNDRRDRKKEDVIAAFDKAIELSMAGR